jgi:uncharacterized protein involved in cysteine biosynthesis
MDKKGQVSNIPQYVISFILIGLIVAVGVVVLDKFMGVSGLSTKAVDALNSTIDAVTPITTDWLPILVIVAIVGVVLMLILGAFAFYGRRK